MLVAECLPTRVLTLRKYTGRRKGLRYLLASTLQGNPSHPNAGEAVCPESRRWMPRLPALCVVPSLGHSLHSFHCIYGSGNPLLAQEFKRGSRLGLIGVWRQSFACCLSFKSHAPSCIEFLICWPLSEAERCTSHSTAGQGAAQWSLCWRLYSLRIHNGMCRHFLGSPMLQGSHGPVGSSWLTASGDLIRAVLHVVELEICAPDLITKTSWLWG